MNTPRTSGRTAAGVQHDRAATVRRGLAAWSRGDPDEAVNIFHPEVEWQLSGIFPDFTGTLRGRGDVRRFWHSFTDPWERIELEPERFHDEGDWLVFEVRFTAVGRDGVRVELPQVHAARFRDGLVIEYRSFRELGEAREALSVA